MAIPPKLLDFLNESREPLPPITDPDELLHIDSLGMIRLMAFLQDEMNIRLEDEEFTSDNFASVRTVEQLLESKGISGASQEAA